MPSEPERVSRAIPLLEGRLHPLTLAFPVLNAVRSLLLPVLVLVLAGRVSPWTALFFLVFPLLSLLAAGVRYFTFTYRIESGELITRQGIFDRTERHIPLSRVQDVRLEQGALHRLFGVFDVHIETGGGGSETEASLSVLGQADVERLRRAIGEATEPDAPPPAPPVVLRQIALGELVVAGLTSNHLVSGLAVVFGVLFFLDDLLPEPLERRYLRTAVQLLARWWEQAGPNAWGLGAALVLLLLLIGMALSVFGSVALFYGFTLTRDGEDLHRAWGLVTRRASRLPRRRIQLLKIEESAPRRFFGRATLRADTAGSAAGGGEKTGRDVLLPILGRSEVESLLPELFPDLGPAPAAWARVSPRAIRRGTVPGALFCLVLAAALFFFGRGPAAALWPLPLALIPLIWALNVLGYRHFGYARGGGWLGTRRGVSQRDTHLVPIRNLQAITLRQSPFDRRHGLATLHADTAGQFYTGGGPHVANLPWSEALALARTLAHEAARARFRW